LATKWGDGAWEQNRTTFRSPQTEHHDGNAFRVISIFPELRPDLDNVYEQPADETE